MKVKYLILGAGISGLAFASKLESDYAIIEKEATPGGLCRTFYQDGFTWDFAGHFFHFKNNESKKYFSAVLGDENCYKHNKNTSIFYHGKMIDYPFQKNIHQLDKEEFIDCLYDLYFKEKKEEYSSFKDMLLGKFGKSICDKFLIPYNEKLYACNLDRLDKDAMGRFFPYADMEDIFRNMKMSNSSSYNDTFIYPKGGAKTIIDHLSKDVKNENLHLNENVLRVDVDNRIVETNKNVYQYDYLINTIPFNQFLSLMGRTEEVFDNLSWNKVLVFNIGFDREAIDKTIHWVYFPDKTVNFYRVGFYNNILREKKLSIYVEIGMDPDDTYDESEQLEQTIFNLKKCGIITDHQVVSYQSLVMNPAYVHVSEKGKTYFEKETQKLNEKSVYTLGRYGGWTYCSMEDCYIDAINLANKLNQVVL